MSPAKSTKKSSQEHRRARPRRASRPRNEPRCGARPGLKARRAVAQGGEKRGAREDRRDAGLRSRHGRADPRDRQGHRAGAHAQDLVRDARVRQGRQGRLFTSRSAQKFKTRYATLGFSDKANLDDGGMWPTDYALKKLTAADEKRVVALVRQAVS